MLFTLTFRICQVFVANVMFYLLDSRQPDSVMFHFWPVLAPRLFNETTDTFELLTVVVDGQESILHRIAEMTLWRSEYLQFVFIDIFKL